MSTYLSENGSHPSFSGPIILSGARILFADPCVDVADYLAPLLHQLWDVDTVTDGAATWRRVREWTPDVIVADILMPGLDALALVRELRTDPRNSTVSIILIASQDGEKALIEGMEAGADDYIVRPFTARE